jgi:hypothetical protein
MGPHSIGVDVQISMNEDLPETAEPFSRSQLKGVRTPVAQICAMMSS